MTCRSTRKISKKREDATMSEKPNVVLIVLDSVRYDRCSYSGCVNNTTSNLDNIKGGIYFRHAYSTSTWSLPSYASMLTGLYPSEHGVHGSEGGNSYLSSPTFVEDLLRLGYTTVAFSRNPIICSLLGFRRGFKEFCELPLNRFFELPLTYSRNLDPPLTLANIFGKVRRMSTRWIYYHIINKIMPFFYIGAEETNEQVQSWLSKAKKPFFLFLIYMDVHDYYLQFKRDLKSYLNFLKDWTGTTRSTFLYDRTLYHLDNKVSELFRILKSEGCFDETVIIVVSDHGEMLGERGAWGHDFSYPHSSLIHVPLVVKDPNTPVDKMWIDQPFSTKDVGNIIHHAIEGRSCLEFLKTYPEWCGAEAMEPTQFLRWRRVEGKRRMITSDSSRSYRAIVTKNYHLIHNLNEDKYELYDLSEDDSKDVSSKNQTKLQELIAILKKWEKQLTYMKPERMFAPKEEIKRRLRALGYL